MIDESNIEIAINDIKCIEALKKESNPVLHLTNLTVVNLRVLIDLAEQVLAVKGLPEKKEYAHIGYNK